MNSCNLKTEHEMIPNSSPHREKYYTSANCNIKLIWGWNETVVGLSVTVYVPGVSAWLWIPPVRKAIWERCLDLELKHTIAGYIYGYPWDLEQDSQLL